MLSHSAHCRSECLRLVEAFITKGLVSLSSFCPSQVPVKSVNVWNVHAFGLLLHTSPPARRLFERLSASNLRPVYPGTPWYDCTLLIFVVACTWLVPLYILYTFYIHFIYILYTFYTLFVCLCLSEFIVAPAAWTMTVVAQARGGSGPRLSATMPAPQQRPSVVIDSDNLQSSPKDFPITRCHTFHSLLQ